MDKVIMLDTLHPEKLRKILIKLTKEYPDVKKIIEKYIENT